MRYSYTRFPPVYYINLDRSGDRAIAMEAQFKRFGLHATRVKGIDGRNRDELSRYLLSPTYHRVRFPLEIATTASHIKAIQQAYKDGASVALVLEDDVRIELLFNNPVPLTEVMTKLPSDWEILHLFGDTDLYRRTLEKSEISDDVLVVPMNDYPSVFAAAYLVSRRGMEKMMDHAYKDGRIHVCDCMIKDIPDVNPTFSEYTKYFADHFLYGRCITYRTTRPYVNIQAEESNIQVDEDGRFLPFHKELHQTIRDFIEVHFEKSIWLMIAGKIKNQAGIEERLRKRGIYNFIFVVSEEGLKDDVYDRKNNVLYVGGKEKDKISNAVRHMAISSFFKSLSRLIIVQNTSLNLLLINVRNACAVEDAIVSKMSEVSRPGWPDIFDVNFRGLIDDPPTRSIRNSNCSLSGEIVHHFAETRSKGVPDEFFSRLEHVTRIMGHEIVEDTERLRLSQIYPIKYDKNLRYSFKGARQRNSRGPRRPKLRFG